MLRKRTEMNTQAQHQSVMLTEALDALNIKPEGIYVDATYGRGGHARAILERLNSQGKLLVLDKDPQALADAAGLAAIDPRVLVCAGSFAQLNEFCQQQEMVNKVNGILFDLGVSSPQLDQADRGFSFMREGPLDMRMDPTTGVSVADWLVTAKVEEIAKILKTLGEERFSNRIANAIVAQRQQQPITTTKQLANLIASTIPITEKHKHPATRSFQALRIFINRELEDLQAVLPQTLKILAPMGRLVIISFHSLEDRIVKQFFAQQARGDDFPQRMPITHAQLQPKLRIVAKALKPSVAETTDNVRARSAVLRVAEKIGSPANE